MNWKKLATIVVAAAGIWHVAGGTVPEPYRQKVDFGLGVATAAIAAALDTKNRKRALDGFGIPKERRKKP